MIKNPNYKTEISLWEMRGVHINQSPISSNGLKITYKRKLNGADYYENLTLYVLFFEARIKGYDFWEFVTLKYKYYFG